MESSPLELLLSSAYILGGFSTGFFGYGFINRAIGDLRNYLVEDSSRKEGIELVAKQPESDGLHRGEEYYMKRVVGVYA